MNKPVTFKGSVTLFYYVKDLLRLRSTEFRVNDGHVGALLGQNPTMTSGWKRGKYRINRIDQYITLSEALNMPILTLYGVASEDIIPPGSSKYQVAIEKAVSKRSA